MALWWNRFEKERTCLPFWLEYCFRCQLLFFSLVDLYGYWRCVPEAVLGLRKRGCSKDICKYHRSWSVRLIRRLIILCKQKKSFGICNDLFCQFCSNLFKKQLSYFKVKLSVNAQVNRNRIYSWALFHFWPSVKCFSHKFSSVWARTSSSCDTHCP